jgi:hypothetical protein
MLQHHTQTNPATRAEHNERGEYEGAMHRRDEKRARTPESAQQASIRTRGERRGGPRTSTKQTLSRSARKAQRAQGSAAGRRHRSQCRRGEGSQRTICTCYRRERNEKEWSAHRSINAQSQRNVRRALGSAITTGSTRLQRNDPGVVLVSSPKHRPHPTTRCSTPGCEQKAIGGEKHFPEKIFSVKVVF